MKHMKIELMNSGGFSVQNDAQGSVTHKTCRYFQLDNGSLAKSMRSLKNESLHHDLHDWVAGLFDPDPKLLVLAAATYPHSAPVMNLDTKKVEIVDFDAQPLAEISGRISQK